MLGSIFIHWRTLCIVFGSLLVSVSFAIAHHLFYQGLAGIPVSAAHDLTIGPWAGMPSQKFNVAVGNTFASLFRMSLSLAVTTAYVQMVWNVLKDESTRLSVVDALNGILANPLNFLNLGAWKKSVTLLLLAILIWLLPIAPIITPATLTVEPTSEISYEMVNVSAVDFNSLNFASIVANSEGRCAYFYRGPQFEVMKVVIAAAGQNSVLSIAAPGNNPNVSYVQQFAGPALQCNDVAEPLQGEILSNINASSYSPMISWGYLFWTPVGNELNDSLPFVFEPLDNGYETWQLRPDAIGPIDGAPLSLYMFASPNLTNPYASGPLDPEYDYYADATIIKCQLVNATYSTAFNWTNGIRKMNVNVIPSSKGINYQQSVECNSFLYAQGVSTEEALQNTSQPLSDFNNTIIESFAYQSVMHAFGDILRGSISYPEVPNGLVVTTSVMSTVLGATKELLSLQNHTAGQMKSLASLGPQVWPGVSVEMQSANALDLRTTLELLFQNITMSLMSSPLLQPDPATPYHAPPVNVTTITYRNLYAYSAAMLWLAYGTALLVATVTIAMGCVAIYSSGLSYSASFSTILRASSHAFVSATISKDDAVGQDPLPKHLAEATITFDCATGFEEEAVKENLVVKGGNEPQSTRPKMGMV
ncbi:hypothetical protein KCU73_g7317, partial [Aureobasidium melanogenum]